MNTKLELVNHEQSYYVGKHGSDSNDGKTPSTAFLTFGAAITDAEAQTPLIDNRFVIYCDDAGVYTENVTTSDYVDIKATSAVIDGSITLGNNTSTRVCTVDKVIKSASSGKAYIDCCLINTPDTEIGVLNSGTDSNLVIFARQINAPLNGIGIQLTGSNCEVHTLINDLMVTGNNGIGVQVDDGNAFGVIEHIKENNGVTGTTGIKTLNGAEANITANILDVDTSYNVAANSTLRLTVQKLVGTETVAAGGIAAVSQADKSTDSLDTTGIVNGCGEVVLNTDISKLDITEGVYYIQGTRYVYAGDTAISPTIGGGDSSTFVGLNSSGLVYSGTKWTSNQKQTILPLARLQSVQGSSGPGSDLISPVDERYIISETGYLQRIWQEEVIGALYSSGGTYVESSTALQIDQLSGVLYTAQRNRISVPSSGNITAKAVYHVSGTVTVQTDATVTLPKYYDNGTDIVALSVNKWATHTLLKTPKEDDNFFLIYGDAQYGSQAEAEAAPINYSVFTSQATSGLIAVANFAIRGGSTNIESIIDFRPRIVGAGATSTTSLTTLQAAYDNSSNPEIVVDTTRGGFTIRDSSTPIGENLLEVENNAGDTQYLELDVDDLSLNTNVNLSTGHEYKINGVSIFLNTALTGTPTAPTAGLGTNTTQIATTAFVMANAEGGGGGGDIHTAGNQSFGVGEYPGTLSAGFSTLTGTSDRASANYGNYQYSDGSILVFIPKFFYRIGDVSSPNYAIYGLNAIDVVGIDYFADEAEANAGGFAIHRVFIDGGSEKHGFFMDKYLCSKDGATSGKSIANAKPIGLTTNGSYNPSSTMTGCTGISSDAIVLSRARGVGFNNASIFMYSALSLLSLAHAQASSNTTYCGWYGASDNFPKGCNSSLTDINDASVTFTTAGDGDANKPLAGSANTLNKTTHNGQDCGVTDINGTTRQVALGITNAGASATDITVKSNGDSYVLKPSVALSSLTNGFGGANDAWGTAANLANNYDAVSDLFPWGSTIGWTFFGSGSNQVFSNDQSGINWLQTGCGIQDTTAGADATGTSQFGSDGCYQYNMANQYPLTAGYWSDSSTARVFCRFWNVHRAYDFHLNGFRAAFYGD